MSSPSNATSNATLVVVTTTSSYLAPASTLSTTRFRLYTLLFLLSLYGLRRYFLHRSMSSRLHSFQQLKQRQRDDQIAAVHSEDTRDLSLISPLERDILSHSATSLLAALRAGRFTARDVALAFIRQTLRLHQRVNLLSETAFQPALSHSRELDAAYKADPTHVGPLHGLPISLKDSIGVAGLDCTLGVGNYVGQEWREDALLVRLLRAKGAQVYCKTNVPQTLLSFECSNPLFGVTSHLLSPAHTAGGSSGGEAALIAGGGSVLGLGTDIGGSVRIPAHFSGVYALKPTARRLSPQGFRPGVPGQEAVPGVVGPMGNSVDDLTLLCRELMVKEAWDGDRDLVPLPLDETVVAGKGKLRVGYYLEDGVVPPSPPCRRAVLETVEALRAAGHECVEWKPPRVVDAVALFYALLAADGGRTCVDQLVGERREGYVTAMLSAINMPGALKSLIAWALRRVMGDAVAADVFNAARPCDVNTLWKLQAKRKAYKTEFFQQWKAAGLDVVVCPAHALPATKHGEYKKVSFTACYTFLYNVLDAPAGVCPVTVVKEGDVWGVEEGQRIGMLEKAARGVYDVKASAGFPIGVQVVAAPFQDELVLRVMKEVEQRLPWKRPSLDL